MRHLVKRHPRDIDACTQFSIAMAFDKPLDEVVADLGWGAVSTKELRSYLVRQGLSATGDSVDDAKAVAQGKGMVVIHGGVEGHAVAFEDGIIYDPNGREFDSVHSILEYYTFHTGRQWVFYTVFEAKPIQYREFAAGKQKEEAL